MRRRRHGRGGGGGGRQRRRATPPVGTIYSPNRRGRAGGRRQRGRGRGWSGAAVRAATDPTGLRPRSGGGVGCGETPPRPTAAPRGTDRRRTVTATATAKGGGGVGRDWQGGGMGGREGGWLRGGEGYSAVHGRRARAVRRAGGVDRGGGCAAGSRWLATVAHTPRTVSGGRWGGGTPSRGPNGGPPPARPVVGQSAARVGGGVEISSRSPANGSLLSPCEQPSPLSFHLPPTTFPRPPCPPPFLSPRRRIESRGTRRLLRHSPPLRSRPLAITALNGHHRG